METPGLDDLAPFVEIPSRLERHRACRARRRDHESQVSTARCANRYPGNGFRPAHGAARRCDQSCQRGRAGRRDRRRVRAEGTADRHRLRRVARRIATRGRTQRVPLNRKEGTNPFQCPLAGARSGRSTRPWRAASHKRESRNDRGSGDYWDARAAAETRFNFPNRCPINTCE